MLVDRMGWGLARDIPIEEFISLVLDYRSFGTMDQQLAALQSDYESVGWRSMSTGQRIQVDAAYWDYLVLIRCKYQLDLVGRFGVIDNNDPGTL